MRIARARSLGLSEIMSAIWVLEYLLELFLIGYPCSCLRAIAHDLPWSAAACQVEVGDSHLDSDGWIEGLFKHEEFEEKERLIITKIGLPWQTNGGQAC